jgi:CelD/BcsL family acetyltransferase involved in cellulose biosynthesis
MEVEALESVEELVRLRPAWQSLWVEDPRATPFQAPGWLLPWVERFSRGRLFCPAAFHDGQLIGLAPLEIAGGRAVLLGRGVSDYGGFLLAPGADGVAEALIARALEACDECELDQVPPGNPLAALADEALPADVCPSLRVPSTPGELPHGLGARIARSLRRLAREDARFETADADSLPELLTALFDLHTAEWRERGGGVMADPEIQAFHRAAASALLEDGLRLHALRAGGAIEAVIYGFCRGGRFYSYLGGHGPRLAPLSPGTLMIWRAMEAGLARDGLQVFDFLRGAEPYKYRWGAEDRWNHRLLLRRRAL